MPSLVRRSVEAEDLASRSEVEEVRFRCGDVVAQLPVGDGDLDGVEAFVFVDEVVGFGVRDVVDRHAGRGVVRTVSVPRTQRFGDRVGVCYLLVVLCKRSCRFRAAVELLFFFLRFNAKVGLSRPRSFRVRCVYSLRRRVVAGQSLQSRNITVVCNRARDVDQVKQ